MFFINVMSYPFQKWIRYKNKEQNASFYSMSPLVGLRTLAWQPFPVLLFLQLAILAFSEIKDIVLTGQCQDSHVYMTRSLATEGMLVVSGGGDKREWWPQLKTTLHKASGVALCFAGTSALLPVSSVQHGRAWGQAVLLPWEIWRFYLWPRDYKPYCCHLNKFLLDFLCQLLLSTFFYDYGPYFEKRMWVCQSPFFRTLKRKQLVVV